MMWFSWDGVCQAGTPLLKYLQSGIDWNRRDTGTGYRVVIPNACAVNGSTIGIPAERWSLAVLQRPVSIKAIWDARAAAPRWLMGAETLQDWISGHVRRLRAELMRVSGRSHFLLIFINHSQHIWLLLVLPPKRFPSTQRDKWGVFIGDRKRASPEPRSCASSYQTPTAD